MKKSVKALLVIMAMAGIAVLGLGAYKLVEQRKNAEWEEERVARVLEVDESTTQIRDEIASLSKEEIEEYISEKVYIEDENSEEDAQEVDLVDPWADNSEEDIEHQDETLSENDIDGAQADWESGTSAENVSRVADLGFEAVNDAFSLSQNDLDDSLSENSLSDNSLSDNSLSENSLSDNSLSQNTLSGNSLDTLSGNTLTLKYRQKFRTSCEETALWATSDQEVIDGSNIDFSSIKIACLGDSVTAGSNMDDEPDYQDYTYPTRLGEILNAESVTNLGIGGSSLGRYWDQAFCDRYNEIPEDTDLIIVMGGYNDGYCLHEDMVGNIDDREPKTLYGDVNDLFKGLKEDYPEAEVIVVTPLPNLLHDVLRKERPELLPQTVIIDCLKELADEYEYQVIDDYNSNFFDSHDADIVEDYIPDSVHPNKEGYDLLAKHIAAEIIRMKDDTAAIDDEDSDTSKDDAVTDSEADSENDESEASQESDEDDDAKESDNPDRLNNEDEKNPEEEDSQALEDDESSDDSDTETDSSERKVYARD